MIGNVSGAVAHVFRAGDLSAIDATVPVLVDDVYDDFGPGTNTHRVYNFEVADHHTYIADGIRVHNTSVLSLLDASEFPFIVADSLRDLNGDGSFDSVELDNNKRGVDAVGTTVIKVVEENGELVREDFVTSADEYGRLIFTTYRVDENNKIIEESIKSKVSDGAVFGEAVGKIVTPFLSAAILSEDASTFERIATDSILGAFVQNAFEFAGGSIESNIRVNGLSTDSVVTNNLDDIADITFAGLGVDILQNAVGGLGSLLTQWVMAEIFEGLEPDSFEGKLASTLTNSGVNFLADKSLYYIADNVIDYTPEQLKAAGFSNPDFQETFSLNTLGPMVLSVAINSLLPTIETPEGQIGSSIASAAVSIFELAGTYSTYWAPVIGFAVGRFFDALFDKDPEALSTIGYNAFTGEFAITGATRDDGGNIAISNGMAQGFADFINGIVETAQSKSNNLSDLAQTLNLTFGYIEENYQNGDGVNYSNSADAVQARIAQAVNLLELRDGDAKVAQGLIGIVENSGIASRSALLSEIQLRLQIAVDYQAYLEDQGLYDSLIAADPQSEFAAGWAATFLLAKQYGFMNDFSVVGDFTDSIHLTSTGNDFVDAKGGDDEIHTYAGNDTLHAGGGDDSLYGGSGDDSLNGGSGDDLFFGGSGDNILVGGDGIDQFYMGLGNNTVSGGDGTDLITFDGNYSDYTVEDLGNNNVKVSHNASGAINTLEGVEFLRFRDTVRTFDPSYDNFVVGTAGDDLLNGTDLRDAINGLAGNDTIYGFDGDDFISGDAGDDQLFGGAGNDWIFGVLGNDVLYGGPGNDPLNGGADGDYLWGESGNDILRGEGGGDVLNGGLGNDSLSGGEGDDLLEGADGSDILTGDSGDDRIFGGNGSDNLHGGKGDDRLFGGQSNDVLNGGQDDDVLNGGAGADLLQGEGGDDVFYGGAGDDQIFGGWGSDIAFGGDGNDKIFALARAAPSSPFSYNANQTGTSAASHHAEWGADIAYGGGGNDQIGLNSSGSMAFGGEGNDTIYVNNRQIHVDGGFGHDKVRFQNTNFQDAIWYQSSSGKIGAITWDTNSAGTRIGAHSYNLFVGVEEIQAKNGKILIQGYSFNNGYGNAKYQNPTWSGFIQLTDQQFSDAFAPLLNDGANFLSYRLHHQLDPAGGAGETFSIPAYDWEQLGGGDDSVYGSTSGVELRGDQRLRAGDGNDQIYGGDGNDQLDGQAGNDMLYGENGADILIGGDGADTLQGESGADIAYGGAGDDAIYLGSGDDNADGGSGQDAIRGHSGHDAIYGGDDNDQLFGGSGRDTLDGGNGNDQLNGGDDPDTLLGGEGNDTIYGEDGGDNLSGGAGDDSLLGGLGIDNIEGGAGNDKLRGQEASDKLSGGEGRDTLFGGEGQDNLYGNEGNDVLSGGMGNDMLVGGDGEDSLDGGDGADLMDGGLGRDIVDYGGSSSGVSINLLTGYASGGEADGDRFVSIEDVYGSGSNDKIIGSEGSNVLSGHRGNDTINGLGGDDTLEGSAGQDTLFGGDGNDSLTGGTENDLLRGDFGDDFLEANKGNDIAFGGAGNDQIYGDDGSDYLSGDTGNDTLNGGNHDDVLTGGAGDDVLYGGEGADILIGNIGNDVLVGGTGDDLITGGQGVDTFVYSTGDGNDTITDFEVGTDILEIDGLQVDIDDLVGTDTAEGLVLAYGDGGTITLTGVTTNDFDTSLNVQGTDGDDLIDATYIDALGNRVNNTSQTIFGLEGNDTIVAGTGNDDLDGGSGDDSVSGGQGADTIRGNVGEDLLEGDTGSDLIFGGDGNDVIDGGEGDDDLEGNAGDDLINGGAGDDVIFGGTGVDTIYGGEGQDTLRGGGGADYLDGGNGEDLLFGTSGEDEMHGGNGDDILEGLTQSDTLFGGNGEDVLRGGDGYDELSGDDGDDVLSGGNGIDRLEGGLGADILRGDAQNDTFVFSQVADSTVLLTDVIEGIEGIGVAGGDVIDLSGIDANILDGIDSAFTFLGVLNEADGLAFGAGALWLSDSGDQTRLFGNVDDDGVIDFLVKINDTGVTAASDYTSDDFIL